MHPLILGTSRATGLRDARVARGEQSLASTLKARQATLLGDDTLFV